MRTTWLITLVLLGPWIEPFYWFFHILRDGSPVTGRRPGPLGLN
jgi:hypothetical protein